MDLHIKLELSKNSFFYYWDDIFFFNTEKSYANLLELPIEETDIESAKLKLEPLRQFDSDENIFTLFEVLDNDESINKLTIKII